MARLLVAADLSSLAQRAVAERLAAHATRDGHEASVVLDAPLAACKEADAAVCILDGPIPGGLPIAVAASAHALGLPTLALHTHALPDSLASLFTQAAAITREADMAGALAPFYAQVRPFAGKLVRDQVPRLVREAGHQVQFREAAPEERARYLKRKVADEAAELLAADPGQEREEVADLLEALETLLRVRGFDRDNLRLVKEAKRKRRGGFERFLIVESASTVGATPSASVPDFAPAPAPAPTPWAQPAQRRDEEPSFGFDPQAFADAAAPSPSEEEPPAEFAMPSAFLEPEPEPAPPTPVPEVAAPSWLTVAPVAAAPPAPAPSTTTPPTTTWPPGPYGTAPATRTVEDPAPVFQPPAIPSFRVQQPPPLPHNRTKLWNLGSKGEQEDIPAVYDDPDRIDPHVREI